MNNLAAIEHYFSTKALSEQKDFRIRLPGRFIDAIDELSKLCFDEHIDLNVYDAMISAAIGQLKIKTASPYSSKSTGTFRKCKSGCFLENTSSIL
ncbi:hypothetical protein Lsan_2619 [Legionella santicrucis]|uniref:Uncharacterized protein n=1 Tax=Legionella santicrucis TaxID=45074 RepID=A0A0W0YJB3_9GAMM|nr:hypothetical protein [Legionella santicrucis]KTD56997.1 hypothetical protein Lsan_2619 [Legionella santicrucis]